MYWILPISRAFTVFDQQSITGKFFVVKPVSFNQIYLSFLLTAIKSLKQDNRTNHQPVFFTNSIHRQE